MRRVSFRINNDTFVTMEPINARVIKLTSTNKEAELHKKRGNIVQVCFGDYTLSIGDQVSLKEPFKIFRIEEIPEGFFLHSCELSKSSYFLFPMLGEDRTYFWWNSLFTNCYIDIEDIEYKLCGPHIYLVYRFSKNISFSDFEAKLESHPLYIETFDVDPYQVMYAFKVPDKYQNTFNLFRQGKYSQFDNSYKERIINFHDAPYDSELSQILSKSPKRREKMKQDLLVEISDSAELYDIPHMCTETFYNRYLIKNSIQPNVKFEKLKEKV